MGVRWLNVNFSFGLGAQLSLEHRARNTIALSTVYVYIASFCAWAEISFIGHFSACFCATKMVMY